jgi:hypothetical protein
VLNGTAKGAYEILWCMAANRLHHDRGNTITSEDRKELDELTTRAANLAFDLYRFMRPAAGSKQLRGSGILIPFPGSGEEVLREPGKTRY